MLIDLRSDTVTRPTAGMLAAMSAAEVGDEQRGDDPTVESLNDRVAELLGKERAVFLPSGTMCNLIALLVLCRRGEMVIVEETAHILRTEAGGGAAIAGVQFEPVRGQGGVFLPETIAPVLEQAPRRHRPRVSLVAVEQTSNICSRQPAA